VIGMPIGNLQDVTFRAIEVLRSVDIVLAEDTRNTLRFLHHYDIKVPIEAFHEHNEVSKAEKVIQKIKQGEKIALVSDAGTPCVSDPGYRLVASAIAKSINVIPIPGVSAAITAVSVSGLPSDGFVFVGFLPRKKGKQKSLLESLALLPQTLILYESPRRIISSLEFLEEILGNREAVLAREMTKVFEEFLRGTLTEIITILRKREGAKGECTLLVAGYREKEITMSSALVVEIKKAIQAKEPVSSIARRVSAEKRVAKKMIYEKTLKLKNELEK